MPPREPSAFVWDIRDACQAIQKAVSGIDLRGYLADEIRRVAVERWLITIGEAINRLSKLDPAMAAEPGDVARTVAFRNVLVHGYFKIDHAMVWETLRGDLPPLAAAADRVWSRFAPLYPDTEGGNA